MEQKRIHVWISGRVQGVFFRAYTRDAAAREGVTGWVRNMPDGRVEAVFQGPADAVLRVIDWCYRGSPLSRVDKVEIKEEPISEKLSGFEIRY